jgi:predicted ribosomally synthesized peptide with SipW-like signal peptide
MKKRSILISMMVIGVVAALIAAATTATFSDQVTSNGNTFTAGTLYMSVDAGTANDCGTRVGAVGKFGADATPTSTTSGGPDAGALTGCDIGKASFTIGSGANTAGATCQAPDGTTNVGGLAPGTTCSRQFAIVNKGSLNGSLTATPTITSTDACGAANWQLVNGATSVTSGSAINLGTVNAKANTSVTLGLQLKDTAPNTCQGASATVDIVFHLVQA